MSDGTLDRVEIENRTSRIERRQNRHLLGIGIPVILALLVTAVGYGELGGRVNALTRSLLHLETQHGKNILALELIDRRQWDQIRSLGPILLKVASDVAYLRGIQAAQRSEE